MGAEPVANNLLETEFMRRNCPYRFRAEDRSRIETHFFGYLHRTQIAPSSVKHVCDSGPHPSSGGPAFRAFWVPFLVVFLNRDRGP